MAISSLFRYVQLRHLYTESCIYTELQDVQFMALKEKEYFMEILMNLSKFKDKKSQFWLFSVEN